MKLPNSSFCKNDTFIIQLLMLSLLRRSTSLWVARLFIIQTIEERFTELRKGCKDVKPVPPAALPVLLPAARPAVQAEPRRRARRDCPLKQIIFQFCVLLSLVYSYVYS